MRKLMYAILFELYALLLAWVQAIGGVRTDEAKYLLNIPYPHPPLARSLIALTSRFPYQELLWRVIFATLVVQAAWIVWWMARELSRDQRVTTMAAWLLCAAVVLQAGSVMMAPLTALEGLLFLALLFEARRNPENWGPWQAFGAGLLWLVSLLTAYQAVLYFPIVVALFLPLRFPWWQKALYVLAPLPLALLFGIAEPAILASFVNAGALNTSLTPMDKALSLFQAWCVGGSILIGIVGIVGMALDRQWAMFLSLALVAAFLYVSFRMYYAILFTPLLVAGMVLFLRRAWSSPVSVLGPVALITVLCVGLFPPSLKPGASRAVMQSIALQGKTGTVLIAGSFGHDWQYESSFPVLRFHPSLLTNAQAVVCLDQCDDMKKRDGWVTLPNLPTEVWVRENDQ